MHIEHTLDIKENLKDSSDKSIQDFLKEIKTTTFMFGVFSIQSVESNNKDYVIQTTIIQTKNGDIFKFEHHKPRSPTQKEI